MTILNSILEGINLNFMAITYGGNLIFRILKKVIYYDQKLAVEV